MVTLGRESSRWPLIEDWENLRETGIKYMWSFRSLAVWHFGDLSDVWSRLEDSQWVSQSMFRRHISTDVWIDRAPRSQCRCPKTLSPGTAETETACECLTWISRQISQHFWRILWPKTPDKSLNFSAVVAILGRYGLFLMFAVSINSFSFVYINVPRLSGFRAFSKLKKAPRDSEDVGEKPRKWSFKLLKMIRSP